MNQLPSNDVLKMHEPERIGTVSEKYRRALKRSWLRSYCKVNAQEDTSFVWLISLPTITVRVACDNQTQDFTIPRNLLWGSCYFQAALKREWLPESDNMITYNYDIDAFAVYIHWLCEPHPPLEWNRIDFELLGKAYILGDMITDACFKTAVCHAIVIKFFEEKRIDLTLPGLIYENTITGDFLRQSLVFIYQHYGQATWLTSKIARQHANMEFLTDLNIAQFNHHRQHRKPEVEAFLDQFLGEGHLDWTKPALVYAAMHQRDARRIMLVEIYNYFKLETWLTDPLAQEYANEDFLIDLSSSTLAKRARRRRHNGMLSIPLVQQLKYLAEIIIDHR